ncbi:hypothetical protein GCM10022215_15530 [Nocardioides fonticola]|uniref:DUF4307 domain-containing protein n=1 Tax=Nocardioides fonticola TaxID=450363 RepID=A0ABP7XHD3_9ACTN
MTSSDLSSGHLSERYGTPSPWRRRGIAAVVAAFVAAFACWLAWTTWIHANPQVSSELLGFTVEGEHAVTARVAVDVSDGVDPTTARCLLRAYAEDHNTVGEFTFTPAEGSGRYTETIRTERRATSADVVGCTTPDQNNPS